MIPLINWELPGLLVPQFLHLGNDEVGHMTILMALPSVGLCDLLI